MPRSASDRKFGWKAKGILRILTSADIDEVRKALDALSIDLEAPAATGVEEAIRNLVKAPFELLEGLLDLVFDQVIPFSENHRNQIRVLDAAIAAFDVLSRHDDILAHHSAEIRVLLSPLRKMRGELAKEILRAGFVTDEIERIQTESQTLKETQETSLNKILDTEPVA